MNGSSNSESVEDRLDRIEAYLGTIAKAVSDNQEGEEQPKGFFNLSEPILKYSTTVLAAIAGTSGLIYAFCGIIRVLRAFNLDFLLASHPCQLTMCVF